MSKKRYTAAEGVAGVVYGWREGTVTLLPDKSAVGDLTGL